MDRQEFAFPSATGVCTISACAYLPGNEPDTVAVLHHGMAEHRGRYEALAEFLCGHGIGVYMHDMANHGKSNGKPEETGWFGETDGWRCLVRDYRTLAQQAAAEHPGAKLIVMGHSWGLSCAACTSRRFRTGRFPEPSFWEPAAPTERSAPGFLRPGSSPRRKERSIKAPF